MSINTVFEIIKGIHVLSVLGILVLLLLQANKSPRKLNPGIIHAGLTALIAGILLVSLYPEANPDKDLNHMKVGIKALVLGAVLFLGYRNVKKETVKTWVWGTILGLVSLDILIAIAWH